MLHKPPLSIITQGEVGHPWSRPRRRSFAFCRRPRPTFLGVVQEKQPHEGCLFTVAVDNPLWWQGRHG